VLSLLSLVTEAPAVFDDPLVTAEAITSGPKFY
jgi:hypothetical protein